jgi:hypothetical protein
MSWGAQNRSQDAKIRSAHGTRSDCLKLVTYGIQRYAKVDFDAGIRRQDLSVDGTTAWRWMMDRCSTTEKERSAAVV